MKNSDMNLMMSILVLILYLMMMSMKVYYKLSLNFLLVVLFYLMLVSKMMVFFILYEMVFILIMFVILVLGYNYERLMASFLMMFYSFLFSSPVLMMIMLLSTEFLMKEWLQWGVILNYFLMGSFMVKFPIFGFHYWLPVAHVEASTLGSMLLAGVLLKLGSLGLWYLVSYLKFMVKLHWVAMSVSLVMIMILSLSDLKMMIAYSSVAHMTLVFYIFMIGSGVGVKGGLGMMFYHGFVSPLMFWVVGLLAWWKTRSLMVIKLISFSFLFSYLVFILMLLNMSFPPMLGFLSEILMLKSLLLNLKMLYVVSLSVLLSCYYNIYLFWVFNNHGVMIFKLNIMSVDVFMYCMLSLFLNYY